jgi:hypothetical protein
MTKSAGSRLRLSVLDQSPISEGSTLTAALRNSIALAVLADSRRYHRYWVAEHHGSPGFGCMSPEILIGPIAAATSPTRVGSGGVMLPHYSPFKVAENFSMLASRCESRCCPGHRFCLLRGLAAINRLLSLDWHQRPSERGCSQLR